MEDTPKAVTSRVLRLWWENSPANRAPEHSLSLDQTDGMTGLLQADPGTRCNLPSGWRAERGERYLHLLPPEEEEQSSLPPSDRMRVGGLQLQIALYNSEAADGKKTLAIPRSLLNQCCVRNALPGDRITPVHSGHARPLRELFRERGVEVPFRRWIPLLCDGPDVLAVPGLGSAEIPARSPDDEILLLRWTGDMPWIETEV